MQLAVYGGALISFLLWAEAGGSAEKKDAKKDVDSVLDRLEKRLMDSDRESLSFGDEPTSGKDKKGAKTRYNYAPRDISPRQGDEDQVAELSLAITQMEGEIETYSSDVQRLKQKILEEAALDNLVTIEGKVESPEQTSIRTLNLRLDGFTVYTIDEVNGLWLPRPIIPFFNGPLTPGTHKLQLDARIARRKTDGIPVGDNTFQAVSKTFDLEIPDGKARKSWVLAIKTPDPNQTSGEVELQNKGTN